MAAINVQLEENVWYLLEMYVQHATTSTVHTCTS